MGMYVVQSLSTNSHVITFDSNTYMFNYGYEFLGTNDFPLLFYNLNKNQV